jgi:hypothetical protein
MLLTELKKKSSLKNGEMLKICCNSGSYRKNDLKRCQGIFPKTAAQDLASSHRPPMFTGNADFTIRILLVMIPAHLWPRPGLTFRCPDPHYHSNEEATETHILQHQELCLDGAFYDPLIAPLAGLTGSWIDMSDVKEFVCPLYVNRCSYRTKNVTKLKIHLSRHLKAVRLFQKVLSVFSGAIVKHYIESKEWPSVEAMPNKRSPHALPGIYLIYFEEVVRYRSYGIEEGDDDEAEETAINEQTTEEIESQVQVNFSEQNEESGKKDQKEKKSEEKRREEKQCDAKIVRQISTSKA